MKQGRLKNGCKKDDYLNFAVSSDGKSRLIVRVMNVVEYPTIREMVTKEGVDVLLPNFEGSLEEAVNVYRLIGIPSLLLPSAEPLPPLSVTCSDSSVSHAVTPCRHPSVSHVINAVALPLCLALLFAVGNAIALPSASPSSFPSASHCSPLLFPSSLPSALLSYFPSGPQPKP